MLDRVAMHQTRLRLPGLGIDSKGVALGSRGLVLLASIERLVAFLSLYSSSQSLQELLGSLRIEVVRSKLGTREVVLSFDAQGSERLDRVSEVARVALGYVFTGSARHFVQYRDRSAPFGYDAGEVLPSDSDYVLYHNSFTQVFEREREIDLAGLLLRLRAQLEPSFGLEPGPSWLLAEEGLGPAFIHYLIRSQVEASVGVAEWPPLSALEDTPVRRFLFHVPSLPERMRSLVSTTPGLVWFKPVAPGAAVQVGYRHPVTLRACPVFPSEGLVLFSGQGQEPLVIERLPAMGAVHAFAKVSFHQQAGVIAVGTLPEAEIKPVQVPVRLLPSVEAWRSVKASFVLPEDYPLLRRMLYVLGPQTLRTASIAFTAHGAFLLNPNGVESTPVGQFLRELRPGLFVAAGYEPVPAIEPSVLYQALGAPSDYNVFLLPGAAALGVLTSAFVPLSNAMIEGLSWAPLQASEISQTLSSEVPRVVFDPEGSSAAGSLPQLPP